MLATRPWFAQDIRNQVTSRRIAGKAPKWSQRRRLVEATPPRSQIRGPAVPVRGERAVGEAVVVTEVIAPHRRRCVCMSAGVGTAARAKSTRAPKATSTASGPTTKRPGPRGAPDRAPRWPRRLRPPRLEGLPVRSKIVRASPSKAGLSLPGGQRSVPQWPSRGRRSFVSATCRTSLPFRQWVAESRGRTGASQVGLATHMAKKTCGVRTLSTRLPVPADSPRI